MPRHDAPDARVETKASLGRRVSRAFLSPAEGVAADEREPGGGLLVYGAVSPAVALIVGPGLEWTVAMISELSIPWR